jgi:hypothetical protein
MRRIYVDAILGNSVVEIVNDAVHPTRPVILPPFQNSAGARFKCIAFIFLYLEIHYVLIEEK